MPIKIQTIPDEVSQMVKEQFRYDPETGVVERRDRFGWWYPIIRNASLKFNQKIWMIQNHRIAWFLHEEEWPDALVDHRDGYHTNNKWDNLRLASCTENNTNRAKTARKGGKSTTSKYKGVCWDSTKELWLASIGINGALVNLGRYADETEAAQAYDAAARASFGSFARTNFIGDNCLFAVNPQKPPPAVVKKKPSLEETFWLRVNKDGPIQAHMNTPCWQWIGPISPGRYGRLFHEGKSIPAHRVSYRIHKGEFDDALLIRHDCDNPTCVNPEHLQSGTSADNAHDMVSRGRGRGRFSFKKRNR